MKCNHIWTAAYLPMEMTLFGKLLQNLRCPMCAATNKDITPAKQNDGALEETGMKPDLYQGSSGHKRSRDLMIFCRVAVWMGMVDAVILIALI